MQTDASDFDLLDAAERPGTHSPPREKADGEPAAGSARARATGLGWFSVALGASELLAPAVVASLIGARPNRVSRSILQTFGVRELAAGMGILTRPRAGWLWARVAGDVLDIAALAAVLGTRKRTRATTWLSLASVVGVTILDAKTALELSRSGEVPRTSPKRGVHFTAATTINRSTDEVYHFWHDFRNLPRFMANIESVDVTDGHSRWRAKGPVGSTLDWEAETTIDRPGEMIAWRSSEGAELPNSGSVTFAPAPGGRGTNLRVELRFDPPAGPIGAAVARLFSGVPEQMIKNDLRRLKQIIETGEVVHSDASVHKGRHPARPAERDDRKARKVGR
jgi:uncharacterized membrane protein